MVNGPLKGVVILEESEKRQGGRLQAGAASELDIPGAGMLA